jgi:hypothetical protein
LALERKIRVDPVIILIIPLHQRGDRIGERLKRPYPLL